MLRLNQLAPRDLRPTRSTAGRIDAGARPLEQYRRPGLLRRRCFRNRAKLECASWFGASGASFFTREDQSDTFLLAMPRPEPHP